MADLDAILEGAVAAGASDIYLLEGTSPALKVDGILREHARVLEHDGPDRCLSAPVGELLVLSPGNTKRWAPHVTNVTRLRLFSSSKPNGGVPGELRKNMKLVSP